MMFQPPASLTHIAPSSSSTGGKDWEGKTKRRRGKERTKPLSLSESRAFRRQKVKQGKDPSRKVLLQPVQAAEVTRDSLVVQETLTKKVKARANQ